MTLYICIFTIYANMLDIVHVYVYSVLEFCMLFVLHVYALLQQFL